MTFNGLPITSSEDLKLSIVNILCSVPIGGIDLDPHHNLIRFTLQGRDMKIQELLSSRLFLRHHALGWNGPWPAGVTAQDAAGWPDIVTRCQLIAFHRNTPICVDCNSYFNS